MSDDDTPNDVELDILERARVQANIMNGMSENEALDHIRDVMGGVSLVFGVWHHDDDAFEIITVKGERLLQNEDDPLGGLCYDAIPCTDYRHALSIQRLFGDGAPTLN